jgi:DNA mismatch repair ATPase MutS
MKYLIIVLAALSLTGCYTQHKATTQFNRAVATYPELGASFCAWTYPIKESVKTDTFYKKADNVDYTPQLDSLNNALQDAQKAYIDAIDQQQNDTSCVSTIKQLQLKYEALLRQYDALRKGYKKCVPDTVYMTKIITQENTARISSLKMDSTETNYKLAAANNHINKLNGVELKMGIALAIMALILGMGIYLKIKKLI